jgi:hypothetical protein
MTWGWEEVLQGRLDEHLLHEWDIAVVLDPGVGLAPDGVVHVIDSLGLVARYTAKPTGETRTITVLTFEPDRRFTIDVGSEAVDWRPGLPVVDPTSTMPGEAFVRLVYGRLDPDHTPPTVAGDRDALGQLRRVFPGP